MRNILEMNKNIPDLPSEEIISILNKIIKRLNCIEKRSANIHR